jgi:hypothetical protein
MILREMDILLYRKLEHTVVWKVDNERPFTMVFMLSSGKELGAGQRLWQGDGISLWCRGTWIAQNESIDVE